MEFTEPLIWHLFIFLNSLKQWLCITCAELGKHKSATKCIMGWWVPLPSGCPKNHQKSTCVVDCSLRVRPVTDYICPVAVCNEQGEGRSKRKKVCFSPGKSRQSYWWKEIPKWKKSSVKIKCEELSNDYHTDFVSHGNKDYGFSKWVLWNASACECNTIIINRKPQIMHWDA